MVSESTMILIDPNFSKENGYIEPVHEFCYKKNGEITGFDVLSNLEKLKQGKVFYLHDGHIDKNSYESAKMFCIQNQVEFDGKRFQEFIFPGYDEITEFLYSKANDYDKISALIPIMDGGVIPAQIIKHKINSIKRESNLPEVYMSPLRLKTTLSDAVCSNGLENDVKEGYFFIENKNKQGEVLIVEDIVSYGKTLSKTLEILSGEGIEESKVKVLCLIFNQDRYLIKNEKVPENLEYMLKTKDHEWVIFPWEEKLPYKGIFI